MSYQEAKEKYAALGIDTDSAIAQLKAVPVSLHCWQGDDVRGFDTDPKAPPYRGHPDHRELSRPGQNAGGADGRP